MSILLAVVRRSTVQHTCVRERRPIREITIPVKGLSVVPKFLRGRRLGS
jgi:regulator of RNase E activity RraA